MKEEAKESITLTEGEFDRLSITEPGVCCILVPESLIKDTPNDVELGSKVRKLYWDSKQK